MKTHYLTVTLVLLLMVLVFGNSMAGVYTSNSIIDIFNDLSSAEEHNGVLNIEELMTEVTSNSLLYGEYNGMAVTKAVDKDYDQMMDASVQLASMTGELHEQELLRINDGGSAVKNLQLKLKELGFNPGQVDGMFGMQTEIAVKQAQQFFGLDVDGIVGPKTWSALQEAGTGTSEEYRVQPGDTLWNLANRWDTSVDEIIGLNDISNPNQIQQGDRIRIPGQYEIGRQEIRDLSWGKVDALFPLKEVAVLTDVETGLSFRIKRLFGTVHADVEPLTARDTAILREIYGGQWSWDRRAVVVQFNGYLIAGSINGYPHGDQAIFNNNFNGHICLHFNGSRLHNSNTIDEDHQNMVARAAGMRWPLRGH